MCSAVARDVRRFWVQIQRVVQYKANAATEMERRKQLDKQLTDLVGKTEEYSTSVAAGLKVAGGSTDGGGADGEDDADYRADIGESEPDDESTLAQEEAMELEDSGRLSAHGDEAEG